MHTYMLSALACLALACAGAAPADELVGLLEAYFREQSPEPRRQILADIEALPDVSTSRVAQALPEMQLWEAAEPGVRELQLPNAEGEPTRVVVRVPPGYDSTRRWPVLVALHGTNGRAEDMLAFAQQLLGPRADQFLIAAPQDIRGDGFHDSPEEAGQPLDLIVALRRRFHVDSDRVYLTGYSLGGHGTLMLCLMHGDLFAAGVPLAGTLLVPRRHRLYPTVLPNLAHVPILLCWGERDVTGANGGESPVGGMAGENDRLAAAAKRMGLPLQPVELPGVGHGGVVPPADLFEEFTAETRARYPAEVTHWFRYPAQGHAYWLDVRKFRGRPWTGVDLPTLTLQPGEDPEERVTQEIVNRLAMIGGRIDGQRIEVEMKRVSRLAILISDEMLDLDRPITVVVHGEPRFEGRVQRRVSVMLEEAARTWDFQRLFSARLMETAGGKVLVE